MVVIRFLTVVLVMHAVCGVLAAEELKVDSVLLTISSEAEVAAREPGVLSDLRVREGDQVKPGQFLGNLDDDEAKLAREHAAIELERSVAMAGNDIKLRLAKKELQIAQAELKRAMGAAERLSNSVSAEEFDRLKLEVERATLNVEQTDFEFSMAKLIVKIQENQLRVAEERLRRRQLISPIQGTVVSVQRHLGESLEAGQTVARLIATDQLRAEGFLLAEQLQADLVGRRVTLTVRLRALENEKFPGTIAFVHPEVDAVTGQARVWARIENPEGKLRPGLSGSMTIAAD